MWAVQDKLPLSNCSQNHTLRLVVFFGVPLSAQGSGRIVALTCSSIVFILYALLTIVEIRVWLARGGKKKQGVNPKTSPAQVPEGGYRLVAPGNVSLPEDREGSTAEASHVSGVLEGVIEGNGNSNLASGSSYPPIVSNKKAHRASYVSANLEFHKYGVSKDLKRMNCPDFFFFSYLSDILQRYFWAP